MWNIKRAVLIGMTISLTSGTVVAQRVRWDENEQIREAVMEAQRRLKHHGCAKLFGQNASEILISATFSFLPLGKPQLLGNGTFHLVNAATIRENNTILLNADGAFSNPRMRVGSVRFDAGMNEVQMRALIILHELGHLTGAFRHDANDPFLSRMYTEWVREDCF